MLVEGLPRHAVRAAEIAAVHHRNAQIVQRAVERIARPQVHGQGNDGFAFGHAALYHHEYSATGVPLATVAGPGGSSTNPSVPIREVKSPEPRVGFGAA